MNYRHEFLVRAPLAAVAEFHTHASSLVALTPPPLRCEIVSSPTILGSGDRMRFNLRFGPLAIRWLAEIEDASERGFTDRQLESPFAAWSHRHSFVPQGPEATTVKDEVTAALSRRLGPRLIGIGMWLGMPILFAYRGWRTRRMLEGDSRRRRARE